MATGINKIDDEWLREQREISERMNKEHLAKHARTFSAIMAKTLAEGDDEDDAGKRVDHHAASTIADLLVEAGSFPHRAAALQHLLHKPSGQALLQRMHKAEQTNTRKGETMHTDSLESVLKDWGPARLCKGIADRGRAPCTEAELVALITKHEGGDKAFAKLCEREPVVLRACAVAKATEFSGFKPQVFGREAMNPDNPVDMVAAYAEILRDIRGKFPYRTGAQQMAMADEELARQYHVRPTANAVNVYAPPEMHSTEKRDGAAGGAYHPRSFVRSSDDLALWLCPDGVTCHGEQDEQGIPAEIA